MKKFKNDKKEINLIFFDDFSILNNIEKEKYGKIGIQIHITQNYKKALDMIKKDHIDAIFLNLDCLKFDPFKLIDYFKNTNDSKQIPIIASSIKNYNLKNIDLFIKSPINSNDLIFLIKKKLNLIYRSENRFYVELIPRVKSEDGTISIIRSNLINIDNISSSGFFIKTKQSLQLNMEFNIEMILPNGKKINAISKIVRKTKENDKFGYGVKFKDISEFSKETLKNYIQSIKKEDDLYL